MPIATIDLTCPHCSKGFTKRLADYTRAVKNGSRVYCSRSCSGLGRRKSDAEKKEVKRLYDIKYREDNEDELKRKGKLYCESPAGRAMQKRQRDKNQEAHAKYIKTDRYRAWKKEYDKKHCAKKNYGEFWESAIILNDLEKQFDRYETRLANGTLTKSQQRRRAYYRKEREKLNLNINSK